MRKVFTENKCTMKKLNQLLEYGQSYWLDNLTRGKIKSGEIKDRVEQQGLRGITSNPSIFNKAITKSADYDDQIRQMAQEGKAQPKSMMRLPLKMYRMHAIFCVGCMMHPGVLMVM